VLLQGADPHRRLLAHADFQAGKLDKEELRRAVKGANAEEDEADDDGRRSADDLIGCIREVLAGKTYLAPAAAAKLAEGVTRVRLTPRELAALRLLADGKANKEIATALDISERTVKTHLGHLFEKLGVTSRTEAVKVATRRGLVRLE